MSKVGFHVNNKKLLLTYPHTDYEPGVLLDKFTEKVAGHEIEYAVASREKHEDGSYHNHLFVVFKKPFDSRNQRCFDLEGRHPNIEKVKSTPWKTVSYVKKDGEWIEYHPENEPMCCIDSMSRSEKLKFLQHNDPVELFDKAMISAEQCMRMIKAKQFIENFRQKNDKREKPIVLWFYGQTGSGKTRTAVELARESGLRWWISSDPELKWFDGYDGQEYVIIDDFRRQGIKFNWMLRLTDRYQIQVQIKGGFTWWKPKVIIFTCPVNVRECYTYIDKDGEQQEWDNLEQFIRRIDDEIDFDHQV